MHSIFIGGKKMTDKLFQNEHEIQEMIDADNKVKDEIIAKHNELSLIHI